MSSKIIADSRSENKKNLKIISLLDNVSFRSEKINSHTCGVKDLLFNKSFGNGIEDKNEKI